MKNLIRCIREELVSSGYDDREAMAVARMIAEQRYHITFTQAYAGTARELTSEETEDLQEMLSRLKRHEPVQYVLGEATFMDLTFSVKPGVLIPRPETEDLVKRVVSDFAETLGNPVIVDAGTGSGCIAVALKLALPQARVLGVDISEEALGQAEANARKLHADVEWMNVDLLNPDTLPHIAIDVLVSNPPYVMDSEKKTMEKSVTDYEPELALFVPDDEALMFYSALARFGKESLKSEGRLYVEINSALGKETAQLFRDEGYRNVELLQDRFGKDRIVTCRK